MNFLSVSIDNCRAKQHKFRAVWSDKTPMKVSLMCDTCSIETGKSAYVAYGSDVGSWGQWRGRKRRSDEEDAA